MILSIPESEVFPRLTTDSESMTFSDSCVKSDIANIIKKIYSPRPLTHYNLSMNDGVESRDSVGDNVTISRTKEKKEKLFGFYFEPVTRPFAKTFVDSSTTSGSVSLPIVRYKPKRLRQVCECCKRKIPYRDHETRVNRTRRDCRNCKTCGSDDGHSSTNTCFRRAENPSVHNSNMKGSNCNVARRHTCSNLKFIEEIQSSSMNLGRKQSLSNIPIKHSVNGLRREDIQGRGDCSPVLHLQVVPDLTMCKENNKTHQDSSSQNAKNAEVRNVSFLQRIMSNLFGKNNTLEEGARLSYKKTDNVGNVKTKPSKISMSLNKTNKQLKNKELRSIQVKSSEFVANPRRSGVGLALQNEEMDKLAKINPEQNKSYSQTLTSVEGTKLENVIVHSYPEQSKSTHKVDKPISDLDIRHEDLQKCDQDLEQVLSTGNKELIDEVNEQLSEKFDAENQVAYKGLRIEVDTDSSYVFWAGVFGACHSVVSFFTAFFLHLLTFILQSLIQPLFFGTVRISSDHFFKPCLSTAFESIIQPICYLIERIADSLRDVCLPVGQCFGVYCKEVSHVCKACRVVEINKNYYFNNDLVNS